MVEIEILTDKMREFDSNIERLTIKIPEIPSVSAMDVKNVDSRFNSLNSIISTAKTALTTSSETQLSTANLNKSDIDIVKRLQSALSSLHQKTAELESFNDKIRKFS